VATRNSVAKFSTTASWTPMLLDLFVSLVIGRGSGGPGANVASGDTSRNVGLSAGAIFLGRASAVRSVRLGAFNYWSCGQHLCKLQH